MLPKQKSVVLQTFDKEKATAISQLKPLLFPQDVTSGDDNDAEHTAADVILPALEPDTPGMSVHQARDWIRAHVAGTKAIPGNPKIIHKRLVSGL